MSFDYNLPPTRIKRKYKCTICEHTTINPRIHLQHRINVHGQKLKIVECPLCVYACQYRQKLNRHLKLVHHYLLPNKPTKNQSSDDDCLQDYLFTNPLPIPPPSSSIGSSASMVYEDEQPLDLSYPPELKQLIQYMNAFK